MMSVWGPTHRCFCASERCPALFNIKKTKSMSTTLFCISRACIVHHSRASILHPQRATCCQQNTAVNRQQRQITVVLLFHPHLAIFEHRWSDLATKTNFAISCWQPGNDVKRFSGAANCGAISFITTRWRQYTDNLLKADSKPIHLLILITCYTTYLIEV